MLELLSNYHSSDWHVFLLALGAGIGCHFIGWNEGLEGGLWSFLINTVFLATGYFALALCMAEMTSTLPFVGGNYGFARVSLGAYLGYLVGCLEVIQNLLLLGCITAKLGKMCTHMALIDDVNVEIGFWLVFYIPVLILQQFFSIDQFLQSFALVAGIVTTLLMFLFLISAMIYGNTGDNAKISMQPYGNFIRDSENFSISSWFFLCTNLLPMIGGFSQRPKDNVSPILLSSIAIFTFSAIVLAFSVTSLSSPRVAAQDISPLSRGYAELFSPLSLRYAPILSLLPPFFALYILFLIVIRQVASMANSGLLPAILKAPFSGPPPLLPTLLVLSLAFIAMLCLSRDTNWPANIFNITVIASYVLHLFILSSYVIFKRKYTGLEKPFTNPLGMPAAIYSFLIFFLALLSILVDRIRGIRAVVFVLLLWGASTLYYTYVARVAQCFSEEEQKVLFVAYVINANARSRLQRTKSSRSLNINPPSSRDNSVHRSSHLSSPMRRLGEMGKAPSFRSLHALLSSSSSSVSISTRKSSAGEERSFGMGSVGGSVTGEGSKKSRKFRIKGDNRKSLDRIASKIAEEPSSACLGTREEEEREFFTASDNNMSSQYSCTNESSLTSEVTEELKRKMQRGGGAGGRQIGGEKGEETSERSQRSRHNSYRVFPDAGLSKVVPIVGPSGGEPRGERPTSPLPSPQKGGGGLEEVGDGKREGEGHILDIEDPHPLKRGGSVSGGSYRQSPQRSPQRGLSSHLSPRPSPVQPHGTAEEDLEREIESSVIVPLSSLPAGSVFRRSLGEVVTHEEGEGAGAGAHHHPIFHHHPTGHEFDDVSVEKGKKSSWFAPLGVASSSSRSKAYLPVDELDEHSGTDSPKTTKRGGWIRGSFNAIATIAKVVPLLGDHDFDQYTEEFVKTVLQQKDGENNGGTGPGLGLGGGPGGVGVGGVLGGLRRPPPSPRTPTPRSLRESLSIERLDIEDHHDV